MAKQYVVKALAALVNAEGGFAQLMHRGAVLPDNVDKDQLEHMLDNDIVVEGEPAGGLEPIGTGDGAEMLTHPLGVVKGEAAAKSAAKPGPASKSTS